MICDRLGQPKKLLSVTPNKVYCLGFDNGEYMPSEYKLDDIKPYLRPMKSMTDEEKDDVEMYMSQVADEYYNDWYSPNAWDAMREFVDYCNKRHLDFRGLIWKGLALEASEGMYEL